MQVSSCVVCFSSRGPRLPRASFTARGRDCLRARSRCVMDRQRPHDSRDRSASGAPVELSFGGYLAGFLQEHTKNY